MTLGTDDQGDHDDQDGSAAPDDLATAVSRLSGKQIVTAVVVAITALVGYLGHGRRFITVQPGGAVFDNEILPTFFLIFLASALIALRWPRLGGILVVFTAAAIAPFAVNQLEPWSAVIVIAVFALPALAWLDVSLKRRPKEPADSAEPDGTNVSRRQAIVTFTSVAIAVATGSWLGRYIYDRVWGPTHPESDTPQLADSAVDWFWCGAVTSSSCVVRARPRQTFERARLLVGTDAELTNATEVPFRDAYDRVVEFGVDDLAPETEYHYAMEFDGAVDTVRTGSFRTFPDHRRSVRMAFGSCARIGSNGTVFDTIRQLDPLVYICIGDFHYGDNFVDDVDDYRQVFDVQLTRPAQAALYASVPIAYVWDDHDYGPNDSDKNAPGRAAAMRAYREYVPHYELAGTDTAIYQAFSLGTVRVILTDARSERDPSDLPDAGGKSMLGSQQREWLLEELASSSTSHDLVVWINPVPWVGDAEVGRDSWAGYSVERSLIAEHIARNEIDNLLMVAGDAHMVAIDDGTHTNYSSQPGPAFPLVHVAALDRPGSVKGGPYTYGPIPGGGQFATVDVEVAPDERHLEVTLTAVNWRGEDLLRHRFEVPITT